MRCARRDFSRRIAEAHNRAEEESSRAREKERCDFLISGCRLRLNPLTKTLVTVVIASFACCETAVQQRSCCFAFARDPRGTREQTTGVCTDRLTASSHITARERFLTRSPTSQCRRSCMYFLSAQPTHQSLCHTSYACILPTDPDRPGETTRTDFP